MNALSDPQVVASALTVLMTFVAAAVGFLVRDRMARARPFIAVVRLDGEVRRSTTIAGVPEAAQTALRRGLTLDKLGSEARIEEIVSSLDELNAYKKNAYELLDQVRRFRKAANESDRAAAEAILCILLSSEHYDTWFTLLLGDRHVDVPKHDESSPKLLQCEYSAGFRDGCYAIGLKGNALWFSKNLEKLGVMKERIQSFVALIERMELTKLANVLEGIASAVEKNLAIANDVLPTLQAIVDKHSQWCIRLYVANLASTPLLVSQSATLCVYDANGGKFIEPLTLLELREDETKALQRFEAVSPAIVRSESDAIIDFATTNTQSDMSFGDALRVAFKSGKARCDVKFHVERPGLRRDQKLKSPLVAFSSP